MATTLTLNGPQAYIYGAAGGSNFFGYDSTAGARVCRYYFTTPSTGASKITLSGSVTKYAGDSDLSTYPIRFKITTESTGYESAGAGTSYDGSITNASVNVTINKVLKPNTTYYLWLFPGHNTYALWYAYNTSGATTLSVSVDLQSFKLTTNPGTGSTITVKRTSSPLGGASTGTLANGATIYYNDVLTVTFGASTGCTLGTHTVNGSTFTSGGSHTVTAAVSVVSTATVKSFALSLNTGTGSTITVRRTSSPLAEAGTGTLSNGATVYYGDVLTVTFSANTGYSIGTHTVNGSAFTSGNSHTVAAAVTVVSTATVKSYTLTLTAGTGSTITVTRTSSPLGGAAAGTLSSGAKIYYGDVLKIVFAASAAYQLATHTVNGDDFTSGDIHTVTGAAAVVTITKLRGTVHIKAGGVVKKYLLYVKKAYGWVMLLGYIKSGTEWKLHS